jgi:drug/metabolite transporter (DMT)-like permease
VKQNDKPSVSESTAPPVDSDVVKRTGSLFAVVMATALWSTSGLLINIIVRGSTFTPVALAFWRDLLTFVFLLVGLSLWRPQLRRVARRDLPWLAAMGAISIGLFHVFWNTSVLVNGVAITTVFQSNAPIIVTVVAWALWQEPFTRRKVAAITLAVTGTLFLSGLFGQSNDGQGMVAITFPGFMLGLGVAAAYSTYTLFGKKLVGRYSPWTVLLYIFGFGALALLPFQIGAPLPWPVSPSVSAAFLALVLFTTIAGFSLYTLGLRGLQASVAAIVATTEIPFAAVLSYLMLDERLGGWQILGSVLVVAGVVLLSWPRRRSRSSRLRNQFDAAAPQEQAGQ